MTHHHSPNEFSIIFRLDEKSRRDMQSIRDLLPSSSFRDDPPHVTLLQGIQCPNTMSDSHLIKSLSPLLNRLLKNEPRVYVDCLENLTGGPYKLTSAILFKKSPTLEREHISLMAHLRGSGYRVRISNRAYRPHASVRLGAAYNQAALDKAFHLFPTGGGVGFQGWKILRLTSASHRRPFYELKA